MSERIAVVRKTGKNYLAAANKDKGRLSCRFIRLTGYNRKYAIRVLNHKERGRPCLSQTVKQSG